MEKRFAIKGSNTLFQVWGIIIWVFAGITGLLGLVIVCLLAAGSSIVDRYLDYLGISGLIAACIVLLILGLIISITIQIITGLVLTRNYVKSKGVLIALSVWYFLGAVSGFPLFIFGIAIGSALLIILGILYTAWYAATGVLLILKQNRAIPGGYVPPVSRNKTYAMLEGAYGGFQGRQYRLEVGQTCKIGRESTCDIQLYHPKISRLHCTVTLLANGNFSITDYSSNGTFYGNTTLLNGVATEVRPGDMLVVGEADNVIALKTYSGNAY